MKQQINDLNEELNNLENELDVWRQNSSVEVINLANKAWYFEANLCNLSEEYDKLLSDNKILSKYSMKYKFNALYRRIMVYFDLISINILWNYLTKLCNFKLTYRELEKFKSAKDLKDKEKQLLKLKNSTPFKTYIFLRKLIDESTGVN